MNENEQIADIIRLNDGYVLRIYGQTVACRDEKELGARVARLAKRGRKLDLGAKSAPEPTPIRPEVVDMRVDQREQVQVGNLHRLIIARLNNEMTEEELMDATLLACPDLARERVVDTIQQHTERFFGMQPPDPGQESPLGPKCACPNCKMNQSAPNHLGMCVSCFAGEHLHPQAGQEWPTEPAGPMVVQAPHWETEEDDGDEPADRDGPTDVPAADDLVGDGPGDDAVRDWERLEPASEVGAASPAAPAVGTTN